MPLVNQELIQNYKQLHTKKNYGLTSSLYKEHLQACINDIKPKTILEFGCGQSTLINTLTYDARYHRYDPAISEHSTIPVKRADFIINTDVLEHIPEQDLGDVLTEMKNISDNVFFNIATDYANEILPNGENAHCTVWPAEKWLSFIQTYFPNSIIAYSKPKAICTIITWTAPGTAQLINDIQLLKNKFKVKNEHIFKRIERSIRKMRNLIIGKNKR